MNPRIRSGVIAVIAVTAMGAPGWTGGAGAEAVLPASNAKVILSDTRIVPQRPSTLGSAGQAGAGSGNGYYNGPVTIQTRASGGSYFMIDPTRPGLSCSGPSGVFTKPTDTWGNGSPTDLETACVDVLFAAQKQWDMLREWLGRNGIDGAGRSFPARVDPNEIGNHWNGPTVIFGRNEARTRQLVPLDLVGHEYGHMLFAYSGSSVNDFSNEGAALGESAADIFGTLTEHYVNHPPELDEPDYLIGEEADMTGHGPIRSMYNPSLMGDPNCYSASVPNTEVHAAAGPQNHWFYLLAEGTNPGDGKPASPVCVGPSSLTGIGIRKAGQIFYRALQFKTAPWTYAKARAATVRAAGLLYPGSCLELNAVKAAWNAVNVRPQAGEAVCG